MVETPQNPQPQSEKEDAVARSLKNPHAWDKPCAMPSEGIKIRPILSGKRPQAKKRRGRRKKKRRFNDERDVVFY